MFPSIQNNLSAMRAYARGMTVSAGNIARMQSREEEAPRDTVYLSTASGSVEAAVRTTNAAGGPDASNDMVDMVSNGRAIQANAAVIRTSDKTLGVLLDTVA